MYVVLELDSGGSPMGDEVHSSRDWATEACDELNAESGDGGPRYRVFELTEVGD